MFSLFLSPSPSLYSLVICILVVSRAFPLHQRTPDKSEVTVTDDHMGRSVTFSRTVAGLQTSLISNQMFATGTPSSHDSSVFISLPSRGSTGTSSMASAGLNNLISGLFTDFSMVLDSKSKQPFLGSGYSEYKDENFVDEDHVRGLSDTSRITM